MQLTERAMADLTKIDATIARLEEQLRRARDEKVKLQNFVEVVERYSRDEDEEPEKAAANGRRSTKAMRLREVAHAILLPVRSPIGIGELARQIADQGEEIPGADKGSYLSSVLARDTRFKNIRNVGWLLAAALWATQAESEAEPPLEPEPVEPEPEPEQAAPEPEPDFDPAPEWRRTPRYQPAAERARPTRPAIADELDDDIPF